MNLPQGKLSRLWIHQLSVVLEDLRFNSHARFLDQCNRLADYTFSPLCLVMVSLFTLAIGLEVPRLMCFPMFIPKGAPRDFVVQMVGSKLEHHQLSLGEG